MIHQFTNTNGEQFLAVSVSLDATNHSVEKGIEVRGKWYWHISYDLPDNWKCGFCLFYKDFGGKKKYPQLISLLGISSELTEEQIVELGLVGELQLDKQKGYLDYLNEHVSFRFETAKESLQSRLKSFGFVLENEKVLILKIEDK